MRLSEFPAIGAILLCSTPISFATPADPFAIESVKLGATALFPLEPVLTSDGTHFFTIGSAHPGTHNTGSELLGENGFGIGFVTGQANSPSHVPGTNGPLNVFSNMQVPDPQTFFVEDQFAGVWGGARMNSGTNGVLEQLFIARAGVRSGTTIDMQGDIVNVSLYLPAFEHGVAIVSLGTDWTWYADHPGNEFRINARQSYTEVSLANSPQGPVDLDIYDFYIEARAIPAPSTVIPLVGIALFGGNRRRR